MFQRFAALLCSLNLSLAGAAHAQLPAVADFVSAPEFRILKLTPSGKEIGILGHSKHADYWALLDIAAMQPKPAPSITNLRIENFWWKGDDAVLFLFREVTGYAYFELYDRNTKKFIPLHRLNRKAATIVNPLIGDPEHFLVSMETSTGVDLQKLNVRTGKMVQIERNPGWVFRWLTDRDGRAVAGLGREGEQWFVVTRRSGSREWQRKELGSQNLPTFWPQAVYHDQRRILGRDNVSADTAAVVVWDPETDTFEKIFHAPEIDPAQNLAWGDDETRVRAIAYETDRPRFQYLDPADAALAAEIDRVLPETTNSIVSTSADEKQLIIHSESSSLPARFFLLDLTKGRLAPLGGARSLDPKKLGPVRFLSFRARDGLPLTGLLHLPPGQSSGKPPLILDTGADLTARVSRAFLPNAHLLSTRGYAVLTLNYRGTDGFGQKFAAAGELQLNGAMTDDLADAVRHVIDEGLVDGDRVAIMGEGEAGALALHTLVRHPSLFRAWINFGLQIDREAVPRESLALGRHQLQAIGMKFGDELRFRKYQAVIDPSLQLKAVKVRSFHHYTHPQHEFSGHRAQSAAKKLGLPFVYLNDPPLPFLASVTSVEEMTQLEHRDEVRKWTELLGFLDQVLRQPAGP